MAGGYSKVAEEQLITLQGDLLPSATAIAVIEKPEHVQEFSSLIKHGCLAQAELRQD